MPISVPDTDTFSLADVLNSVRSHSGITIGSDLRACFDNSVDGFFNGTYKGMYKGSTTGMANFRAYNPAYMAIQLYDVYAGTNYFNADCEIFNANVQGELRGIVWSTSPNPTIYNYKAYDPYFDETADTNGTFNVGASHTSANPIYSTTVYYVRPFIKYLGGGYTYGNQITVTTQQVEVTPPSSSVPVPLVYTERFTNNLSANSVRIKGYIENYTTIAPYLVQYGICFRIKNGTLPTISDFKVPSSNYVNVTMGNAGTFTSDITALQEFQEYTARAYVTTTGGTTYGPVYEHADNHTKHTFIAHAINFRPTNMYPGRYVGGGYVMVLPEFSPYRSRIYVENYDRRYIMSPQLLSISGVRQFEYDNAVTHCNNLVLNGYDDWEIPRPYDSIISLKQSNPSIFASFPTDDDYWSFSDDGDPMKYVFSLRTYAYGRSYWTNLKYVIPVRVL